MKRPIYIAPAALAFALTLALPLACSQSKFKGQAAVGTPIAAATPAADANAGDSLSQDQTKSTTEDTNTATDKKDDGASTEKKNGDIPKIADSTYSVTKFGANFEDFSDNDYNDAVLCFKGAFTLNTTDNTIVSLKDQDVQPETFSSGDCHHDITVELISAAGVSTFKQTFPSRPFSESDENPQPNAKVVPALLKVKKDDKLEITMKVVAGVCDAAIDRSMHNKEYTRLLPDICYGDY